MKAMLVYQGRIANVFEVQALTCGIRGRKAKRLVRGMFTECENFCRGMVAAGATVRSAHCNEAGDITGRPWSWVLDEAPFRESMSPINDGPELLSDAKARDTEIASLAMKRR